MKTLCATAVVLALGAADAARADEKADARAVIERAIQATGGAEKLAQQATKGLTFKGKGKSYVMGEADYTGEWAIQPPDKVRFQLDIEANAMKITFVTVFDGKKGWVKINDMTLEMGEDDVAEAKENLYAGEVESLLPLVKGKGFELSPLGEAKVGDETAVGVRVSHKGHRDINLFFDKKTGLLLKSERTIKDTMMGGKERTQETVYSDYKEFDGRKQYTKIVIKRDGEKYVESEMSDFERKDKIDDAQFAKP
jgi:outer membrane lipoprotein-sorting protein